MPFYICLRFCSTPPPSLAALSDSRGSCKMKATALLHVTLPTLPFLFHWPQTPDFSAVKNRLLETLIPPSSPPPYLSPLCSGFYWKVSLRYAHSLPKGFPYARQSPVPPFRVVCLCVRERHQTPLWYKTDREFLVFLGSDPDKKIPRFYHLGFQS